MSEIFRPWKLNKNNYSTSGPTICVACNAMKMQGAAKSCGAVHSTAKKGGSANAPLALCTEYFLGPRCRPDNGGLSCHT